MGVPRGALNRSRERVDAGTLGKLLAGILVGVGLGTVAVGEAVALPAVGTVPSLVPGAAGLAAGGLLFVGVDRRSGCGCDGDCAC